MGKKKIWVPAWRETPPAEKSYRSIFKWGAPEEYKHPNKRLYLYLKELYKLSDDDFKSPESEGNEIVKLSGKPLTLSENHLNKFRQICGDVNVCCDDYSRVYYSCAKTVEEAMELRSGEVKEICDAAVHPRDKKEIAEIVKYCDENKIPIYVYSGGSSVNMGYKPEKGGITLVLKTHMNKIISINDKDQTCTVQPGMLGPAYEEELNNSRKIHNTAHDYTCGHFPQSFEYSTVGGWVVTLGSGQQSSYYGDAYHIVFSQEYVTPAGSFITEEFPACANGPKINDIMKGSEGTFGILVEVTMRIFRHMPQNRNKFGYIFKSFEQAVEFGREISQGEFGMPSVFRISDAEETDIGLKLYGIEGTIIDRTIKLFGFKAGQRILVLGHTEGEKKFSKNVKRKISKLSRKHKGMSITGYGTTMWEHGRYRDPYMREDFADYGFQIDTLETGVRWSNLHQVHQEVRQFVKSRPDTICMTHASHFYPQGTNLYFIFIIRTQDKNDYLKFQTDVINAIYKAGGSLSHHHGVGRMLAPWMENFHGPVKMGIYRQLKKYFDPNDIMNPGAQMGLDSSRDNDKSYRFKRHVEDK